MTISSSKKTTDHAEIRRWAESRGAKPAHIKGTGSHREPGILRFDVPGMGTDEQLEHLPWDAFLKKFDEDGLALVYDAEPQSRPDGHPTKLVRRDGYHRGL